MASAELRNERRSSPLLTEASSKPSEQVFQLLAASPAGLSEAEAAERIQKYGPNEVACEKKHSWWHRLYTASRNPLVILLTVLAILSFATGDFRAGTVMVLMVVLGLALRFVQETRADNAAAKLKRGFAIVLFVFGISQFIFKTSVWQNLWVKMAHSSSRLASLLRVATGGDASCRLEVLRRRSPAC